MSSPAQTQPGPPTEEAVATLLREVYILGNGAPPSSGLRDEDRKKVVEVTALAGEVARIARRRVVVDAAAGHAYLGLVAARLVGGVERLTVIERDPVRAGRARAAAALVGTDAVVDVREGDVADPRHWPERPDLVLGLHACGSASDAIVDAAIAARARSLLLVPCCYARSVAFSARAHALVDELHVPDHAEVRRPIIQSLIDAERTLRLEAAGYGVTVLAFVPRSVSGHPLLWRCRYMGEPVRMRDAAARRAWLLGEADGTGR